MKHSPHTGSRLLRYCGDTVVFELNLAQPAAGEAFVRTNLDRAQVRRNEIVAHTEDRRPVLECDWHDVPMRQLAPGHFTVTLPLLQTGYFKAKAFFVDGTGMAYWPPGDNVSLKVEPAETVRANSIYTAFPRQFGRDLERAEARPAAEEATAIGQLDRCGYAVIPPSGTFRALAARLDFIVGTLGFRIIQLLPVHPVPTTFARMGRYGSPFAATNFYAVDPAFAEFDPAATPLDQFRELVDAVHARHARVFIDLPANHTGWSSILQNHHPEWFARNGDGSFHSPGAWGVVWEDLCELAYDNRGLWEEIANVFLHWCRLGVDGFRCDAGYMVPLPVWEYVTARVRNQYPDCIFMLEGLGGPIPVMESLLAEGTLNWAYSELFQNYSRDEITRYLPGCNHTSATRGTLVHFAETHDNHRLAATSPPFARLRTALSALFSQTGAFGITNGVEWFATEKFVVHGATALNWGAPQNQVAEIARLNAILAVHPAFAAGAALQVVCQHAPTAVALLRQTATADDTVLVAANLSLEHAATVTWARALFPNPAADLTDLFSAAPVSCALHGDQWSCELKPGAVLCLSANGAQFLPAITAALRQPAGERGRGAEEQRLRAKALELFRVRDGFADLAGLDIPAAARSLREQPRRFLETLFAATGPAPVTVWNAGTDERREVMVPPGHFLLVRAAGHFLAELIEPDPRRALAGIGGLSLTTGYQPDAGTVAARAYSLECADGTHFALFAPLETPAEHRTLILRLSCFVSGGTRHFAAPLLALAAPQPHAALSLTLDERALREGGHYALCANELGGMSQVRAAWGTLESQYDAFLAANHHPDYPVDRTVLLRRLRGWVVCRDYSRELAPNCQTAFSVLPDCAVWSFDVPVGQGKTIGLTITLHLLPDGNHARVTFVRDAKDGRPHCLADDCPVKLILRPDQEDRSNHEITRAIDGAEQAYPAAVRAVKDGFTFNPSGRRKLSLRLPGATFNIQPEWHYMVPQPFEMTRGLNPHSDLFSPGYFTLPLAGGDRAVLEVVANEAVSAPGKTAGAALTETPGATAGEALAERRKASRGKAAVVPGALSQKRGLDEILASAMRQFIVRRDAFKTVIAGYPWFLDWGRDTLICLRGMIAAGLLDDSRDILIQFARFEKDGTLPNMIRGNDDSNRDTSDAPLWFFVAVKDFLAAAGSREILGHDCGGRTLLDVLISIACGYRDGTPNGIRMDVDSALVYSPPHFTWMDTNHPAGTPRAGYPIEIQALWHAALEFLGAAAKDTQWTALAKQVRASIQRYYVRDAQEHLSDCLHAGPGTPAARAVADDHCRPNQLLAVTLGAIGEHELCVKIVRSCECLLIPGGIRSLADRPVTHPLPVSRYGQLLNDPAAPYWGRYEGDEDTRRKPAYHNGTAWSWQFPLYPEALLAVYGGVARPTALALLLSATRELRNGCLGQVAEIFDGNYPHTARGCGAQAWGVTELYRVHKLLNG